MGGWLSDPPALNSNWSGPQPIPSEWAGNTESAIVYAVDAEPQGIADLRGNFGVANGIFVWVNGQFRFGALAPLGAEPREYSDIPLGGLPPGINYIQILREDHGGATGYTVEIGEADAVSARCFPGGIALGDEGPPGYYNDKLGTALDGRNPTAVSTGSTDAGSCL